MMNMDTESGYWSSGGGLTCMRCLWVFYDDSQLLRTSKTINELSEPCTVNLMCLAGSKVVLASIFTFQWFLVWLIGQMIIYIYIYIYI